MQAVSGTEVVSEDAEAERLLEQREECEPAPEEREELRLLGGQ